MRWVLCGLLLSGMACGHAVVAAEPPVILPETNPPPGPTIIQLMAVEEQMREAEVHHRIERAERLMQNAQFIEATQVLREALAIDPSHERARERLRFCEGMTGLRQYDVGYLADSIQEQHNVALQELALRVATRIEAGERAMAIGDYDAAVTHFDMALIHMRSVDGTIDWGTTPAEVRTQHLAAQTQASRTALER